MKRKPQRWSRETLLVKVEAFISEVEKMGGDDAASALEITAASIRNYLDDVYYAPKGTIAQ